MKQISFGVIVLCFAAIAAQKASIRSNQSVRPSTYSSSVKLSVGNAASYLLSLRQSDYGWGSAASTSRANVALAFAERVFPLDDSDKKLMKKQLDIQLALDLITPSSISLSNLASYVNAMYATCQDPRNFQGRDLVRMLRTETTKAMRTNFTLPYVLMTLCIAGENIHQDNQMLTTIYYANERISIRSLAVLTMACADKNKNLFSSYIGDFGRKVVQLKDYDLDAYTKPLVIQAANAANLRHNLTLDRNQKEDGSFGDLLSTYYAIPALLNVSLLDLKCRDSHSSRGRELSEDSMNPGDKKVTISLLISSNAGYNIHSQDFSFKGEQTFYDVMKMAESRDPMYRFHCDETRSGKEVFILADVPNDHEKGMSWRLYKARSEPVSLTSKANMDELKSGIDRIHPQDKSHYVFWFEQS